MCHNVILYSRERARIPDALFEDLLRSAEDNPDGFAIFYLTAKGDSVLRRTLLLREYREVLSDASYADLRTLHVHLRRASCGVVSEENVHLWAYGDMILSHNGSVRKYCKSSKQDKSDTLMFFSERKEGLYQALKNYNRAKVMEIAKQDELYGILFIQSMRDGSFIGVGVEKGIYLYEG
ncbi:MAG: hypothetical protein QW221_04555, partial [Candidatus Korarchaeum sp.]